MTPEQQKRLAEIKRNNDTGLYWNVNAVKSLLAIIEEQAEDLKVLSELYEQEKEVYALSVKKENELIAIIEVLARDRQHENCDTRDTQVFGKPCNCYLMLRAELDKERGLRCKWEAIAHLPPPAHPGSCNPETICDTDCMDRFYIINRTDQEWQEYGREQAKKG